MSNWLVTASDLFTSDALAEVGAHPLPCLPYAAGAQAPLPPPQDFVAKLLDIMTNQVTHSLPVEMFPHEILCGNIIDCNALSR